jgi:hypothetical protein
VCEKKTGQTNEKVKKKKKLLEPHTEWRVSSEMNIEAEAHHLKRGVKTN